MTQDLTRPAALTVSVWIVSLASLCGAGLVAGAFGFMAASLDPSDIITAGIEPWTDAVEAGLAFAGLVLATAIGLRLWHSRRFRLVGLAMTALQAGLVAWACVRFYGDYF